MTEEQRDRMMLAILRAVVKPPEVHSPITWGSKPRHRCQHCYRFAEGNDPADIAHTPDCPAALLAELTKGTP